MIITPEPHDIEHLKSLAESHFGILFTDEQALGLFTENKHFAARWACYGNDGYQVLTDRLYRKLLDSYEPDFPLQDDIEKLQKAALACGYAVDPSKTG